MWNDETIKEGLSDSYNLVKVRLVSPHPNPPPYTYGGKWKLEGARASVVGVLLSPPPFFFIYFYPFFVFFFLFYL